MKGSHRQECKVCLFLVCLSLCTKYPLRPDQILETQLTTNYLKLFLPTAYVVRREGNVFTRVCPSIHPSVCPQVRGTLARSSRGGGGYPSQVQLRGTPPWVNHPPDLAGGTPAGWGVPHFGYLPIRPGRVPHLGYPHQIWLGVPHLWYPLSDLARGGHPCRGGGDSTSGNRWST